MGKKKTMKKALAVVLAVAALAASCGNDGGSKCYDSASSENADACMDFCGLSGVEFTGFNDEASMECGDKTCAPGEYCCKCH